MPASIVTAAMLGLIVCNCALDLWGQSGQFPRVYRVDVNLVTLTFSVMDAKGIQSMGFSLPALNFSKTESHRSSPHSPRVISRS